MFSVKGVTLDHERVKRLEDMFGPKILAESALRERAGRDSSFRY